MSNNSDNDKATATKVYPIDLAQKITIIKGTSGADPKVPHLVSGPKISNTPGQIITHAVGVMRPANQIIPQSITTSQPQLANNSQSNIGVGGNTSTPIIQGTQIINPGTQNSGTVRTLPTTVTQLASRRDPCSFGQQILGLPIQQHTQLAAHVSMPSVRPQTTIITQPVTTTKQLTTSYHVPRGPAAVASLAVPRGSAGPRAPIPSPTPNWSSANPQCYVSRTPRPLQVTAQRSTLRQVTPQPTTATVVARVVRPSITPSPQRTPPPQAIQSVSTVRPPSTKVVPLVQRNYQPVKVVGVTALGVRPTISPRTVGNTYYYEVSSGIAPAAQPSSSASSISTQHTVTTVAPHLQQPSSVQTIPSTSVVTQTPAPLIVQQVAIPQQQSMGHQTPLTHSAIVQQQSQTSLSHQNNIPIQSSLPQQLSHSQSNIVHQSSLHQITHKSQLNQQPLIHQNPLTHLSNIAHQTSMLQTTNASQHTVGNQQPTIVQQVASMNSLNQTSITQQTHQPLSTVNLQAHNQLTSFAGALNNSSELGRPPNSPGGPQRPSILRKRDNDGSPLKNSSIPPPPISTSPPPSPGGSTTVSAASSPGPDDDEPSIPIMAHKSHHLQQSHQTSSITQVITQQHNMTHNSQNILQTVLQPAPHQNDQQSYNNCSPRKKPRKQLLPSETRNTRGEECEFPPEGNNSIANNIQATILSPPHAASPPVTQIQPIEREKPPRRAMLGAGWKCGWKATALHFARPTDVRRREERRPSVVELAAQRHVQQKANGWKIHHLTAQMDDLCELENNVLETTANILQVLEAKPHVDHHRILELLKGNIQRTKLVSEGVGEAKTNVLRVFQHKTHVSDILARQADKRCFKKHRNQC